MDNVLRYDLTGKRYGRVIALERVSKPHNGKDYTYWLCRCDCGNTCNLTSQQLRLYSSNRDCGCGIAKATKTVEIEPKHVALLMPYKSHMPAATIHLRDIGCNAVEITAYQDDAIT